MTQNKEQYPFNYEAEYRIAAITSGVLKVDEAIAEMERQLSQTPQEVRFEPTDYTKQPQEHFSEIIDASTQVNPSVPEESSVDAIAQLAKQYAVPSNQMFTGAGS